MQSCIDHQEEILRALSLGRERWLNVIKVQQFPSHSFENLCVLGWERQELQDMKTKEPGCCCVRSENSPVVESELFESELVSMNITLQPLR